MVFVLELGQIFSQDLATLNRSSSDSWGSLDMKS